MAELRIRPFTVALALQWLPCGWRLWRRQWLATFITAGVLMLAILLLRRLPILGDVLLLLALPTVYSSFLIQARLLASTSTDRRPAIKTPARTRFQRAARNLYQALFGAWKLAVNIPPLLVVGLVLLLLGLAALTLLNFIGGQAVVSPYGLFELPAIQVVNLLLAYAVVALLWVGVMLLLFWTLPLLVLRDMSLVEALVLNLRALRTNVLALTVYLLALAAALVPLVAVRLWSHLAGFVALWLGGAVLLALFGCSAYCSFRLVFAEAQPAPRPGAAPRSQA